MAGVGLGTGLLVTKRTGHYTLVTSLQNERRAIYAQLITICDRFPDSYRALTDAKTTAEQTAAAGKVVAASEAHDRLFEEFRSARATAILVASSEVRTQVDALLNVFQQPSTHPMKPVRDRFLGAAEKDILTARKPGR